MSLSLLSLMVVTVIVKEIDDAVRLSLVLVSEMMVTVMVMVAITDVEAVVVVVVAVVVEEDMVVVDMVLPPGEGRGWAEVPSPGEGQRKSCGRTHHAHGAGHGVEEDQVSLL